MVGWRLLTFGEGYHTSITFSRATIVMACVGITFDPDQVAHFKPTCVGLAKEILRRTRASEIAKAREAMRRKRREGPSMVDQLHGLSKTSFCNSHAQMGHCDHILIERHSRLKRRQIGGFKPAPMAMAPALIIKPGMEASKTVYLGSHSCQRRDHERPQTPPVA